jgi:hypothetical protein
MLTRGFSVLMKCSDIWHQKLKTARVNRVQKLHAESVLKMFNGYIHVKIKTKSHIVIEFLWKRVFHKCVAYTHWKARTPKIKKGVFSCNVGVRLKFHGKQILMMCMVIKDRT